MRRRTITAGVVGASLTLWAVSPMLGSSAPSAAQLGSKIAKTQAKVNAKKGTEKVLTRDITAYTTRVNALESRLKTLSAKQSTIDKDLTTKRSALDETQTQLREQRARMVRLQKRLREARTTLSERVVQEYKNGRPDLITVLVEAGGFEQIIERGEYVSKLARQDQNIITLVRSAKTDATALATKLSAIEKRQQKITAQITAQRDAVAKVRTDVASVQSTVRKARNGKRELLTHVKTERKDLEEDLGAMQKQQATIAAKLAGAGPLGPIKKGNGTMIWPVNGPITAPFCERRAWEACHPGMDIGVPIGTPIRAPLGGKVAIAGWVSGYGNYTCLQNTATLSTCFGHQSKFLVKVGQTVTQGQVIGLSGNTGHSTGPHLHFEVRINGAVTNPMNYL